MLYLRCGRGRPALDPRRRKNRLQLPGDRQVLTSTQLDLTDVVISSFRHCREDVSLRDPGEEEGKEEVGVRTRQRACCGNSDGSKPSV
jgi:hypothetical protein